MSARPTVASSSREVAERVNGKPQTDSGWSWWKAAGYGAAAAAIAGGLYMLGRKQEEPQMTNNRDHNTTEKSRSPTFRSNFGVSEHTSNMDNLTDAVCQMEVTSVPRVSSLNALLNDIHVKYVAIKRDDFEIHYRVFTQIIYPLHENMRTVDAYYARYSSGLHFAGSHYDRLRIKKPDEFDMDIPIGMPVNRDENTTNPEESDIVIEPKQAGFVQLRAGVQYQNILIRDGTDCVINSQAYKWLDDKKYITRLKFTQWFRGVVDRALNKFQKLNGIPSVIVDGVIYTIEKSSSGPAYTLIIRNSGGFKLDVDLVPALKFPERRWLGRNKLYRDITRDCSADFWMVVPKPIKYGYTSHDADRSWRVAMHDQERKIISNSFHLRQANRLLKKLRDAQEMKYIASYYIKTLFLWKTVELDQASFWQQDVATIFKVMVKEFYRAMEEKKIRYFWNKKNNLLEMVPPHILQGYANKLQKLVKLLEDNSKFMEVAKFLLTPTEYKEYMAIA